MSLSLALNNALTGLNASQRALSVISNNIANANTEGYSRQIVDLSASYLNDVGAGVKMNDISRKVDSYLQRSIRGQTSDVGASKVKQDYMERIQILLGQPGAQNSLDKYIEGFFNATQSLAETPERTSFRENAVNSGIVLSREVSTLATELEDLRLQADIDIKTATNTINQELRTLRETNLAIAHADALGNPKAGLKDQQDISLKKIAEYMDVGVYTQKDGSIHVSTANGVALLNDNVYELKYAGAADANTLINDTALTPMQVVLINGNTGAASGEAIDIISGGVEDGVNTILTSGKLKALTDLRDHSIPKILAQLDELAATLRDSFNAIHNDGSSFPGTNSLTGTRSFIPSDVSDWEGNVRIAVLDGTGQPVSSSYADEGYTGVRPLNLDLTFLDSGTAATQVTGQPTMQTIIDEINNHFYPPPIKAEVGNLNNIQLVSDVAAMPDAPPIFTFDFDLDNISANGSKFYVTNTTILDDVGANITNVTAPPPEIALNGTNTFSTVAGSNVVTISASANGLNNGDRIYISNPAVPINGIAASTINQFYEVQNVTANSFDIVTADVATATGAVNVAGVIANPPWDQIAAGDKRRIRDAGTVSVDLVGNAGSAYYDITVDVAVDDGLGAASDIKTAKITYRIPNNQTNLYNDRYNNTIVTGNGTRVIPNSDQPFMHAIMVDANGVELPTTNGVYRDFEGFLKLETNDPNYTISIDELNSKQIGVVSTEPQSDGTNRSFSNFFELNNFFKSNNPTATGDTLTGSAINMAVEDRFLSDSNLISLGNLELSLQPADPNATPLYTYERYIGSNNVVQKLAKLGIANNNFDAAGGLASSSQSFNGYVGEVLAFTASTTVRATSDNRDNNILLDGFVQRSDSISGVNIDEELANTVIFQHSYQASARIITVTQELFNSLLATFK